MNEQPGVRPVVVQPTQPNKPMRSLPRNTPFMPVGVTANSVGLGDSYGQRMRRILWIGIPLAVVLALALGSLMAASNAKQLRPYSITNEAYAYNFLFFKSAETVNLVAGTGLKAGNKALAIAEPTHDELIVGCSDAGKQWKQVATVLVEGAERPLCVSNDRVYLVNFYHGKSKHLLEVTYTSPAPTNLANAQQIMQSIKVSLE